MTQYDVGVWKIHVEVIYEEEPLDQIFSTDFLLHIQPSSEDEALQDEDKMIDILAPQKDESTINMDEFEGLVIFELPEEA